MSFCVRHFTLDPILVIDSGLLLSKELDLLTEVNILAEKIREEAIADARRTAKIAQENAESVVRKAEETALLNASVLLKRLERQNQIFVQRSECMLIDLVLAAFDRLLLEVPAREKVAACIKRISVEAPPSLVNAMLYVHPNVIDSLPEVGWAVKPDSGLVEENCRLEAASGEWHADFSATIEALCNALAKFKDKESDTEPLS